ncbi:MAG: NUDIX hydrolase, partial [Candidatus Roizmanbacteria bacterium]
MKTDNPKTIVYQGRIIEVVEEKVTLGDREVTFEFARRSPGTRMIIQTSDGNFLITREKRREVSDKWDYRLPGGKVFDTLTEYNKAIENGDDLAEQARKGCVIEAREEVGIEPENMDLFHISKAGATVVWDLYYFVIKSYKELESQDLG